MARQARQRKSAGKRTYGAPEIQDASGKSPDAFRTISEVAEWLNTPAHVLRFWESKFSHIQPVKRAGGRRYYRPSDMLLIGGIKHLLHDDGMTIKGVQKLLREKGIKHVSGFSSPLGGQPAQSAPQAPVEDAVSKPAARPEVLDLGERRAKRAKTPSAGASEKRRAAHAKPDAQPTLPCLDLFDEAPEAGAAPPEEAIHAADSAPAKEVSPGVLSRLAFLPRHTRLDRTTVEKLIHSLRAHEARLTRPHAG